MELKWQHIELSTINSPTILTRIIQVIKRRRIAIIRFYAETGSAADEEGTIKITVEADEEKLRLIKTQLEKQVDVIGVN